MARVTPNPPVTVSALGDTAVIGGAGMVPCTVNGRLFTDEPIAAVRVPDTDCCVAPTPTRTFSVDWFGLNGTVAGRKSTVELLVNVSTPPSCAVGTMLTINVAFTPAVSGPPNAIVEIVGRADTCTVSTGPVV
jgi:hypothetical protein